VVNNGIPDPCPDFEANLLPRRREHFAQRQRIFQGGYAGDPVVIKLLYLAHCTREKGLFAAIEAVRLAARELAARGLPMRLALTVAGNFVTEEERAEFDQLRQDPEIATLVHYAGFVSGKLKEKVYREADAFIFPTCYLGENQPVNLIEAMAFGLPVVTTRWRSLPEMFPPDYPGLVAGQNPAALAAALLKVLEVKSGEMARKQFNTCFTLEKHLAALAAALRSVESSPEPAETKI
jgi:glycosyltransferase involved in cell wall biosynthesis